MKVLVTGSSGRIGGAIATRLSLRHPVTGFDQRPGPLTTVQDSGRVGQLRQGIPPSGPVDRRAFLLANRLVGNDDTAAAARES